MISLGKKFLSNFTYNQKACNRSWRYGKFCKNLYDMGNAAIFIYYFSYFRIFNVRIYSTLSQTFIRKEGVLQECDLRVTLFYVTINSILKQLSLSVHNSLHVHDLQLSCSGKDMRFVEDSSSALLNESRRYGTKIVIHFSPKKNPTAFFYVNFTPCILTRKFVLTSTLLLLFIPAGIWALFLTISFLFSLTFCICAKIVNGC